MAILEIQAMLSKSGENFSAYKIAHQFCTVPIPAHL